MATIEQQARERVNNSDALKAHEATIWYDWPNWDEHLEWIATASEAEIIDWAESVERFGQSQGAKALGRRGGRIGGRSTSEAKRAASAENGRKGGRPRKQQ